MAGARIERGYEDLDTKAIKMVVGLNLALFAATLLLSYLGGSGLLYSFANGFFVWSLVILASLVYWFGWEQENMASGSMTAWTLNGRSGRETQAARLQRTKLSSWDMEAWKFVAFGVILTALHMYVFFILADLVNAFLFVAGSV